MQQLRNELFCGMGQCGTRLTESLQGVTEEHQGRAACKYLLNARDVVSKTPAQTFLVITILGQPRVYYATLAGLEEGPLVYTTCRVIQILEYRENDVDLERDSEGGSLLETET